MRGDAMSMLKTNGRLHLAFACPAQETPTSLHILEQMPPLRVIRPFILPDGAALVHLHNVSGGILGGDQLALTADLGPQSRVQLTTTGATRIYRRRSGRPDATQTTRLRVARGALLEYLPDPLIPFADSTYRQVTQIEMEAESSLFYWEIVAPGRAARGEKFAYARLQLELDIRAAGRPIALERLSLEPACRPPGSLARLGDSLFFGAFYICRVGTAKSTWLQLEDELAAIARKLSIGTGMIWGVSTLTAHGMVVRAAGNSSREIQTGFIQIWRHAKQALHQGAAIPPRKVY